MNNHIYHQCQCVLKINLTVSTITHYVYDQKNDFNQTKLTNHTSSTFKEFPDINFKYFEYVAGI